ncbi:hypothetical protein ACOSP7_021069 [Xanthoceras sorbifolium]
MQNDFEILCIVLCFVSANALSAAPSRLSFPAARWIAPVEGHIKTNTDASINKEAGFVGLGGVVRNSSGAVLASSAQRVASPFCPLLAEAVGVLRGLSFGAQAFFRQLWNLMLSWW